MLTQQVSQRHQLKILPQQIQLLNFYALNNQELEQRIYTELEENPFLEQKSESDTEEGEKNDDSMQDYLDYDEFMYDDKEGHTAEYQNYFNSEHIPEKPIVYFPDFRESTKQQLNMLDLSTQDRNIAEYLVDALNEKGMLERSVEEIAEDISFLLQTIVEISYIEKVLLIIKKLEPIGLGCKSIQEYLHLQLVNMHETSPVVSIARILVGNYYDALISRQFDKICHQMNISPEQLNSCLNLIAKMNFYPIVESAGASDPIHSILPDFIVSKQDESIVVNLYSSKSDSVFVNHSLYSQMKGLNKQQKVAKQYMHNKILSAQWFVDTIRQREDTMLKIMKTIVTLQYRYFQEGDTQLLQPMILKDISDVTGYDLSTISRITSNKYAETHFGIIYLKDLFSEKIHKQDGGPAMSNKAIRSIIKDTIDEEDKSNPYTDQQIVDILSAKGYKIARRTISKYRDILNIPIAHVRLFQYAIKD